MMSPSHRRRRISRVLLGVLALTIVVGVFTYVRKLSSTRANEVAAAGAAPDPSKVSVKPYQPPANTHPGATAAEAMAEARAKIQAGKMLEARDALNGPFVTGRFKGADADTARALLSEINQTVVFSP